MKKITISHTDLEVTPLNLGGNVFGWTADEQQSFDILDAYSEAGHNFIDTADTYAWWVNGTGGQSETIIGNWLKERGNRDKLVIATKVGSETDEHAADISKKHIIKSANESLKRLQTDYIDLYYTHFDDGITPVEETLAAHDELITSGKVRYIAVSNLSPERIIQSFEAADKDDLPRYTCLQPLYNLMERSSFETDYLPLAEKYGLTVFPYAALALGFLTGKYRKEADSDKSVRGGGAKKYLNDRGQAVLKALDTLAAKHSTKQATVALAWLLAQPHVGAPVVSATDLDQLETLIAAPELDLEPEDLTMLDDASRTA